MCFVTFCLKHPKKPRIGLDAADLHAIFNLKHDVLALSQYLPSGIMMEGVAISVQIISLEPKLTIPQIGT